MKLLHCADIHLGSKTHGVYDSETGLNSRILDVRDRVEEIAVIAEDNDVDLVLMAGDAFERPSPTPTQQRILIDAMKSVRDAAPVVMITGNHDDPVSEGRTHAIHIFSELEGFTVFDHPTVTSFGIGSDGKVRERPGQPIDEFILAALPWPTQQMTAGDQTITEMYEETAQAALQKAEASGLPAVAMGHFTVHGSLPSGAESSMDMSREVRFPPEMFSGFDYTALGHIHKHQDLSEDVDGESGPIVYSSSPERLSFNEEESKKGVVLIDTSDPKSYEFIETEARKFVTITADVSGEESPTEHLVKVITNSAAQLDGAIARIRYRAEGKPVDEETVSMALEDVGIYSIAAVDRQSKAVERNRRFGEVDTDASTKELLETFCKEREISSSKRERMLDMAQELSP